MNPSAENRKLLSQSEPDVSPWGRRRRLRRGGALGFLIVGAAGLTWFWWPSPVQVAIEVPRSELVQQNGRLHRVGQAAPFTGSFVERYPDGALQSRSRVVDGLLHGLSEGWFPDGQLQVREHFREGVSDGVRAKWYPDGQRLSEATIVNGQLEGPFRRWHENGVLAETIEMRQGRPHGLARAYYPSGALKAEARLRDGEVETQESWPDGEKPS